MINFWDEYKDDKIRQEIADSEQKLIDLKLKASKSHSPQIGAFLDFKFGDSEKEIKSKIRNNLSSGVLKYRTTIPGVFPGVFNETKLQHYSLLDKMPLKQVNPETKNRKYFVEYYSSTFDSSYLFHIVGELESFRFYKNNLYEIELYFLHKHHSIGDEKLFIDLESLYIYVKEIYQEKYGLPDIIVPNKYDYGIWGKYDCLYWIDSNRVISIEIIYDIVQVSYTDQKISTTRDREDKELIKKLHKDQIETI